MTNTYALVHDAQALVSSTRVELIQNERYGNRFVKIASGTYADITTLVHTLNEGEALIQSLQEQLATAQQISDMYESSLQEAENEASIIKHQRAALEQRLSDLVSAVENDPVILARYDIIRENRASEQEDSE